MLSATIKIRSIDYETTFQNLFPVLSEKLSTIESKKMVIRLFQQLESAALPILMNVMYRLNEDTKNELLLRTLNAYAPSLKEKINEELSKDTWGQFFKIGTISMIQREGMILELGQVEVDYQKFLTKNPVSNFMNEKLGKFAPISKAAVNMATMMNTTTIEKKALELLCQDHHKERLLSSIRKILFQHGIKVELDEIQMMQENEMVEDVVEENQSFILTEKMENDIISALAGYLREQVRDVGVDL